MVVCAKTVVLEVLLIVFAFNQGGQNGPSNVVVVLSEARGRMMEHTDS